MTVHRHPAGRRSPNEVSSLPNRRVTSREVAKLAGVSQSTVSLVLSGKTDTHISAQTRERVLEAAQQLNYHPNAAARALARQQTHAIGLILREDPVRQTTNAFSPIVIEGIASILRPNGFRLMVESVPDGTLPEAYFNLIHEGHVDGIILSAARPDDLQLLKSYVSSAPVVVWGKVAGEVPFVDVDNVAAARTAVEHLISLGYQRIACIANGPPDHLGPGDRVSGYRLAMQANHLPCDDRLIRYGRFDEPSGFEMMQSLLSLADRPAAVFVASDEVAIGALRAARLAGLRVPQDLAVVGFDDVPMAQRVTPALTTIRLPMRELGAVAAQMLIDMIQTGISPASRFLDTKLVVRETCGAQLPIEERPRSG